jgi:hypothetical protein
MSNPYKERQTHMSRTRRPPDVSNAESSPQFVEAGRLPPAPPHSTHEASGYQHAAVPAWLAPVLQGVTIAMLVVFAFWFGALSKTVEQTARTVEELRVSNERMGNRLTAIETKLDATDKKFDQNAKPDP